MHSAFISVGSNLGNKLDKCNLGINALDNSDSSNASSNGLTVCRLMTSAEISFSRNRSADSIANGSVLPVLISANRAALPSGRRPPPSASGSSTIRPPSSRGSRIRRLRVCSSRSGAASKKNARKDVKKGAGKGAKKGSAKGAKKDRRKDVKKNGARC